MDRFEESHLNMNEFWTSILINNHKERNVSPAISILTSSNTDLGPSLQTSFSIYQTPLNTSLRTRAGGNTTANNNFSTDKKTNISLYENSPILTVMNSSMGSAIRKLRKNQSMIKTQNERIEQMEREMDEYVENCERLKKDVVNLEVLKKTLIF